MAAATVLYWVLPADAGLSYAGVLVVFLLAQMLGMASNVPGGLGVFEGTVLVLLDGRVTTGALVGAVLLYRVFYLLAPLCVALALLGWHEMSGRRRGASCAVHSQP